MPVEMKSVFSSNVSEIGYDQETEELHVTWNSGKTSVYGPGISPDLANETMNSFSIGQAVRGIKAQFPHRYL